MRYTTPTYKQAEIVGRKTLIASRMLVWLNKALHIQSEQRLDMHSSFAKKTVVRRALIVH